MKQVKDIRPRYWYMVQSITNHWTTRSTALRVCHIKRMHSHRTFSGLAQKGRTTMGWFYGFKLHLVINDRGEILNFMITPGNTDDREPLRDNRYLQDIKGKLCGDSMRKKY